MNKRLAVFALFLLALSSTLLSATNPFTNYVDWRYRPLHMHVKDIEGLSPRIVDGKLHLHLHDFLELVLKNSTDIQLTRLDVYTAANDITASKAPFDPSLVLNFSALRSVSPLSFFTFGGTGGGSGVIASPPPLYFLFCKPFTAKKFSAGSFSGFRVLCSGRLVTVA